MKQLESSDAGNSPEFHNIEKTCQKLWWQCHTYFCFLKLLSSNQLSPKFRINCLTTIFLWVNYWDVGLSLSRIVCSSKVVFFFTEKQKDSFPLFHSSYLIKPQFWFLKLLSCFISIIFLEKSFIENFYRFFISIEYILLNFLFPWFCHLKT